MSRKAFNEAEMHRLLELCEKYKSVLECKKTDVTTTQTKDKTWEKIAMEFNALSEVSRDVKVLKTKYKNLKYSAKAKLAAERKTLYGTGGGPACNEKLTTTDEKVLEIINTKESEGIFSANDCDAIVIISPEEKSGEENPSVIEVRSDCAPVSGVPTLRSKVSAPLWTGQKNKKQTSWEKLAEVKSKWTETRCKQELDLISMQKAQLEMQNKMLIEKHAKEMEILEMRLQKERLELEKLLVN